MCLIKKSSCFILIFIMTSFAYPVFSQETAENQDRDVSIRKFFDSRKKSWRDMNVPESDGKVLFDIIIKNNYTKALEIGTSTGHSTIWIAWALSKTGGKLITIEIDEIRYKTALKNLKDAGLSEYVDARLDDAHELVPELKGPFDFVFSDADKGWYKKYLELLLPKLEEGGCFTAHNVLNQYYGIKEFLDYVKSLPDMDTTIIRSSRSGISASYKK